MTHCGQLRTVGPRVGVRPRGFILTMLSLALALSPWVSSGNAGTASRSSGGPELFALGFDGQYANGFAWRRTFDATWPAIERTRGEYDWTVMDGIVRAAVTHGQKVLWVYHTTPSWSITHERPLEVSWARGHARQFLPTDLNDLTRFLEAFWDRYGALDVVGAVEVWNEPNVSDWSVSDPDKYVTLARTISEVTKRKAPSVRVVGISMSSGWHEWWLREVFSRGVLEFLDVVSCHAYKELTDSNPLSKGPPLVASIKRLRSLMAEYRNPKPIWITEAGIGLAGRRGGRVLSQAEVNALHESKWQWPTQPWRQLNGEWRSVSEQRGAGLVVRANVQSLAHGVQQIYWYRQHAREFSWFWNDLSAPTLQVQAHQVFARFLEPGVGFIRADEPLPEANGTDLYAYWFRRPTDQAAILWRQHRTTTQWPMLWMAPLLPEPATVTLPGLAAKIEALTTFGEGVPISVSGRSVTFKVGEDPVYLIFSGGTMAR